MKTELILKKWQPVLDKLGNLPTWKMIDLAVYAEAHLQQENETLSTGQNSSLPLCLQILAKVNYSENQLAILHYQSQVKTATLTCKLNATDVYSLSKLATIDLVENTLIEQLVNQINSELTANKELILNVPFISSVMVINEEKTMAPAVVMNYSYVIK